MDERILVIDDEPLILATIDRALTKQGYSVRVTSTISDFLDCLRAEGYNLLVMDVHLGGMRPEVLLSKVKNLCPKAKILTISGSVCCGVEDRQFLQKPFRISDLRQKVRDLLDEACKPQ